MLTSLLAAIIPVLNPVNAILTDIEGTTTSISFVYDTLFPYAKQNITSFLSTHENDLEVQTISNEVQSLTSCNQSDIAATLLEWMNLDKKITPLKTLQGLMWEEGYRQRAFQGHVYGDAYEQIKSWHGKNIPLYIYSSGSVYAQKLLFSFSTEGDITPLFSGYFDTKTGEKKDKLSYINISEQIGIPCGQILFLSDSIDELDAAKDAGLQTFFIRRAASLPQTNRHPSAADFNEVAISLESSEAARLLSQAAEPIIKTGHFLSNLNLCSATSGNLSCRVGSDLFAITVSGKHKGELTAEDVILVNGEGKAQYTTQISSAETSLHTLIYRYFPRANAVLHTHSVNGTVLSRLLYPQNRFITKDYEIHKAFQGITTHQSQVELPIFENSQDYASLCKEIGEYLQTHPQPFGFFLRGHGLYTWGEDLKEAKIRTEAFEFLFDCELKTLSIYTQSNNTIYQK